MDAMRQLVFPSGESLGFLSVQVEIFILCILSVVFIIAARLMLSHMEKLAIREGRLTENRR
jgi:membrane protein implicated in regulation of membrane protease activity